MSRLKRGVSLAELLVTLALMSVAMAILATLFRAAIRQMLHSEHKESEVRAALACCQQIRNDLESAIQITSPAAGATSSTVTLVRMNPFEENLTMPLLSATATWEPHPVSLRWAVTYMLNGSQVVRTVTPQGGSPWQSQVAIGLSSMQCSILTNASGQPVSGQVRAQVGSPVRVLQTEFPLHLPPQVVP